MPEQATDPAGRAPVSAPGPVAGEPRVNGEPWGTGGPRDTGAPRGTGRPRAGSNAVTGEGPSRVCPACYGINAWSDTACRRCGSTLETARDFDGGLIWALEHPDTGTAILAARLLGERRQWQAIEPLARLSRRDGDPYRAAAAVRALRAFAGDPIADAHLAAARSHPSVIVRRAASEPAEGGPGGEP